MPKNASGDYTAEQVAMTLAAIAYADEIIGTTVKDLLANPKLATAGQWELVWGPHKKETNQVYVVCNSVSGDYVIAIRGTEPTDPFSWLLDFEADLETLPWDCGNSSAQISMGMVEIWKHITSMPDIGEKLGDFLGNLDGSPNVFVTGHSQGGATASMIALWVQQSFPQLKVQPYTFAGETAGNEDFAKIYSHVFQNSQGGRYINEYDVVPRGFENLASLPDLYSSQSITLPEFAQQVLTKVEEKIAGDHYTQPMKPVVLPKSEIYPKNPDYEKQISDLEYFEEMRLQHSHIRYLWSMDAPYEPIDPSWKPIIHLEN